METLHIPNRFVSNTQAKPQSIKSMKQSIFNSNLSVKKTRKPEFLVEMNCVEPRAALIAPYYPKGKSDRRQFAPQTMPRIHLMQHWFTLSAPAIEEAFDVPMDRELHSSKKANQWYFGMKAHIGEVAHSGLVHTVLATAGHVHYINEGNSLPHGQQQVVFVDADCQGIQKRPDAKPEVLWHAVMPPSKKKALDKSTAEGALLDAAEKLKAGARAKVEHPFRVIKRQFGRFKADYLGLKKSTEHLLTLLC